MKQNKEYTNMRVRTVARNTLDGWKKKYDFKDHAETVDAVVRLIRKHKMVGELG